MNRKSGSGSGPFLMEMLVVVGFFIICASICIMVFVKSDNISREARDINQAVLMAQSLTEELKAGVDPQWSQQLPDRNIWQHLAEADGENEEYAEWNRELVESFKTPDQITGFEYEVEACRKAIRQGSPECPQMPQASTVRVMEIMDTIRGQWGFRYPCEM